MVRNSLPSLLPFRRKLFGTQTLVTLRAGRTDTDKYGHKIKSIMASPSKTESVLVDFENGAKATKGGGDRAVEKAESGEVDEGIEGGEEDGTQNLDFIEITGDDETEDEGEDEGEGEGGEDLEEIKDLVQFSTEESGDWGQQEEDEDEEEGEEGEGEGKEGEGEQEEEDEESEERESEESEEPEEPEEPEEGEEGEEGEALGKLEDEGAPEMVEELEEEVEEYEFTKQEVKLMKAEFLLYLKGKDTIPFRNVGSVLRGLGLNPTEMAITSYAKWLDVDPLAGLVKFDELLIIVGREKKVIIDEDNVLEAFHFLDVENEGNLSVEFLYSMLCNTVEKFTREEWAVFNWLADPKRTGKVDYENFVARMGPNPPVPEKKGKKGKGKGKDTKKK